MSIILVVLILFGSFSNSLSNEKCQFGKIYKEVFRFCRSSEYPGCKSDLNNLNIFLNFFLLKTEFFCNLPSIKGKCKPCSITATSWNDLITGLGNATSATGNDNKSTGNGTSSSGN